MDSTRAFLRSGWCSGSRGTKRRRPCPGGAAWLTWLYCNDYLWKSLCPCPVPNSSSFSSGHRSHSKMSQNPSHALTSVAVGPFTHSVRLILLAQVAQFNVTLHMNVSLNLVNRRLSSRSRWDCQEILLCWFFHDPTLLEPRPNRSTNNLDTQWKSNRSLELVWRARL